jgi:glyoxylase-like metal-dependent hydrolase (beta-lactamase superfamily II)
LNAEPEVIVLPAYNPGPMTGSGNNTYLIVNDRHSAVLIDAGVGNAQHLSDLSAALEKHAAELTSVIVTHGHPDHANGAAAVAKAHPRTRFLKYPWPGVDDRFDVAWMHVGEADPVAGGGKLKLVHTPGHSPDHLAVWYEPARTMFTGDLVVQGSSVMIHSSQGGNLGQYMRSLERILSFEPALLLPAHGPRVDDPQGLITSYLEHRRMRERQVVNALQARRDTVETIAESIYDGLDVALMPAARENVRAHLEKLREDGRAVCQLDRWSLEPPWKKSSTT